jgi:regulator of sigma D
MLEEILGLYDTFLGRFKFFRNLIHVLKSIWEQTQASISGVWATVNQHTEMWTEYKDRIYNLENTVEDLKEQISKLKPHQEGENTQNFTQTRPAEIVDRIYQAYQTENNK